MPMTALTNVADWDTMLGYIRNALNTAGWTLNQDLQPPDVASAANGRILVATNGDCLAGLRSTQSGSGANRLYLFDGVPPYGTPAFTTMDALPNNSGIVITSANYTSASDPPGRVVNPQFSGPFPTAKIFTDNPSTYCHIVVEVSAGRFRHIAFGNATKKGTWTGGGYYAIGYWNQTGSPSHIIDDPSSSNHCSLFDNALSYQGFTLHYVNGSYKWCAAIEQVLNTVSRRACRGSMRGGFGTAFRSRQNTAWSGRVALVPVLLAPYTTTDTPATVRLAAQIPDMFEVNMRNITPGQILSIGANDYYCYPLTQKGAPADRLNVENSGYYGVAYKLIP